MVRKGGNSRVSSKRPTTAATVVGPPLPPIGQPAITYGGSGGGSHSGGSSHHHNHHGNGLGSLPGKNAVVVLPPSSATGAEDGLHCPQCNIPFDDGKFRRVTDSCGHVKCRFCIVTSEEGCVQCGMGGSSPASGAESGGFTQYNHHQNNKKGPTIVNVTKQSSGPVGSHHLTRRAAAAHRLQSGANSRTNSVNSARPTSSSPSSSASNDTGRQSSSVYSDSADSDSCLRFSSSAAGGMEHDGYPATIDFEAMAELTSPNLDTGYLSISDLNAGYKSYTSIINEDSEFSKSLMSLRTLHEPSIHNNNNNSPSSSSANATLGTASHGGLVTRAQMKEMPSLALVSATATPTTVPSSPPSLNRVPNESSSSLSKRRSRDSSKQENKIATGGGSPDITEGVPRESPKLSTSSTRQSPQTPKTNSSAETEGISSSITGSRLGALLTRSGSRNSREKVLDTPPVAIPTSSSNQSSTEAREVHSNSVVDSSPPSSSSPKKGSSDFVSEQVVKEEEGSMLDDDGSGDDSKGGDEDDDDVKMEDGEGGDDPVPRKKKKRSPVVIHDHITVLGGEPPMYQCNVCQKKFKTKAHIKYHEFCQKGDKPFKCEQCGQGFIAKSHYEYHLRTHTGERPYVCPKCGKGFNQRGKVTRHMRSHTGEKPFVCQECNRGFANAQALRSHTLIHTGERPFACTYCNKRFTGMTNLKKHVITHTGERPFSCNHCGKSFGLKWTLDLHLRTHSSERPYACDQCSRAFSNSKDLRRHLVIHSGERPFKCWICGTAFRRKDNLDRHIKNTHNQPKEVAKKLANEAAAEYLKQTTKNQSLGNIPVSKVNSVVISNIIKNADLMPAGGIVPNNLHNKFKQSGGSTSQSNVKVVPKVSSSTSNAASSSPATATATTSSVQQSSPTSRRRVLITAPLSPPTTRATRSKETDSNKIQLRNSSISLSPSTKKGKSTNKQTDVKGKGASTQPTPPVHPKKEKVPASQVVPKEEAEVPKVETKEKKRKSKKKKAKKSKSKRKERVPTPPSPPITVESAPPKKGGTRKSGDENSNKKEDSENVADVGRDQRLQAVNFCDDLDQRRPTLTLVTVQSPKREEDENVNSSITQQLSTPPPPIVIQSADFEQASLLQREIYDEQIECILPHDISEIDEVNLMDTLEAVSDVASPGEKETYEISLVRENEKNEEGNDRNAETKDEEIEHSSLMIEDIDSEEEDDQLITKEKHADEKEGHVDNNQLTTQEEKDCAAVDNNCLTIQEESVEQEESKKEEQLGTQYKHVDEEESNMEEDQLITPEKHAGQEMENEDQLIIHEKHANLEESNMDDEQLITSEKHANEEIEDEEDDHLVIHEKHEDESSMQDDQLTTQEAHAEEMENVDDDLLITQEKQAEEEVENLNDSQLMIQEENVGEEGDDMCDDQLIIHEESNGEEMLVNQLKDHQEAVAEEEKETNGAQLKIHSETVEKSGESGKQAKMCAENSTVDDDDNRLYADESNTASAALCKSDVPSEIDEEENLPNEDSMSPGKLPVEPELSVKEPSTHHELVEVASKIAPIESSTEPQSSMHARSHSPDSKEVLSTDPESMPGSPSISDKPEAALSSETSDFILSSISSTHATKKGKSSDKQVDDKASTQLTPDVHPEKEKVSDSQVVPKEAAEVPEVETKEKKRKSKKKKVKKSKSKRKERVPTPPSPPITVESGPPQKDDGTRKSEDKNSKKEDVENVVDVGIDQRLQAVNFCDDLDQRRPTLTLVTAQSPKREENEIVNTSITQQLSTPPPSIVQTQREIDDEQIESTLPHDISEIDEVNLMDTQEVVSDGASPGEKETDEIPLARENEKNFEGHGQNAETKDKEIEHNNLMIEDINSEEEDDELITGEKHAEEKEGHVDENQLITQEKHANEEMANVENDQSVGQEKEVEMANVDNNQLITPEKLADEEMENVDADQLITHQKHANEDESNMEDDQLITPVKHADEEIEDADDDQLVIHEKHADEEMEKDDQLIIHEKHDDEDMEDDQLIPQETHAEKEMEKVDDDLLITQEKQAEKENVNDDQLMIQEENVGKEEDDICDDQLVIHEESNGEDPGEMLDNQLKDHQEAVVEEEKEPSRIQLKIHNETVEESVEQAKLFAETSIEAENDNRLYTDESNKASAALCESDENVSNENSMSPDKLPVEPELSVKELSTQRKLVEVAPKIAPIDSSSEPQSSMHARSHSPDLEEAPSTDPDSMPGSPSIPDKTDKPEATLDQLITPEEVVEKEEGNVDDYQLITQEKQAEEEGKVDNDQLITQEKHAAEETESLNDYQSITQEKQAEEEGKVGDDQLITQEKHAAEEIENLKDDQLMIQETYEQQEVENMNNDQVKIPEENIEEEDDDMYDDDQLIIHEESNGEDTEEMLDNQLKDHQEAVVEKEKESSGVQLKIHRETVQESGEQAKMFAENSDEEDDDDNRLYVDESNTAPAALCESDVPSEDENVPNEASLSSLPVEPELSAAEPSTQLKLAEVESKSTVPQSSSMHARSHSPDSKEAPSTDPESMPSSPSSSDETEKPEATLPPEISDFILSVLDHKSNESLLKMDDDLESISSASLASPQSDVENSIKMCIQTLESDSEEESSVQISKETCEGEKEELSVSSSLQVPVSTTPPSYSTSSSTSLLTTTSFANGKILTTSSSSSSSLAPVISQHQKLEPVHRLTFPSISSQLIKLPAVVPPAVSSVSKASTVTGITKLSEIPNPLIRRSPKPQYTPVSFRPRNESSIKTAVLVPERSSPPMVPKEQVSPTTPPPPKSVPVSKADLPRSPAPVTTVCSQIAPKEPPTPKLALVETISPKPVDTGRGPRLTLVDHGVPAKFVPPTSPPPTPSPAPTSSSPTIEWKTPHLVAVEHTPTPKVVPPAMPPVAAKLPSFEMSIPKLPFVESVQPNKPSLSVAQSATPRYSYVEAKSSKLATTNNNLSTSIASEDIRIPTLTLVQHIPSPKPTLVDSGYLKMMDSQPSPVPPPPTQSSANAPPMEKFQPHQTKKPIVKPIIQQQVASANIPTVTTSSHCNIQPRANGMVSSVVVPPISPMPSLTLSSSTSKVNAENSTVTITTQSQVLTEAGNKRPREEYYQAVPTRVQFLLPQSAPPVSTVADAPTSSLSVSTTTHPTTTPIAYDPSLLYFVQPSDGQQAFEGNYQLVYAAAAATTERDEGVIDGPPNKVRLLYAEALGVGSDSQNGNELQFYYAATAPDQQVQHTSSPYNVQLMEPCRVTYSQTTNDARSEMLQYHVQHNQQQQHQQNSHNLSQQQQQVLNLSVNNSNPVYYYNYSSSTATISHPPPPPPPPPQSCQQQPLYNDHGQYSSASTAKLVVANQNAYPELEPSHLHQHHNYRQYNHGNTEVQDLSSRRLDLPVHTARTNEIAYAHVRSNDPVQYNFLEKAREVQHVFPQGAFRHCDSNMSGYGSQLSSMSNQNMPNGVVGGYAKNGSVAMDNMGGGGSSVASGSSGALDESNGSTGGTTMSGLELLTAASEKIKAMQYEAMCTERAAAAIAAVGELARLKRLGSRQGSDPQQQIPSRLQQQQHTSPQERSSPYMFPPKPSPADGIVTIPQEQHSVHLQSLVPNHRNSRQLYQEHSQTVHPLPEMHMVANSQDHQQAGIRRGPRKYYLSRSAEFQD